MTTHAGGSRPDINGEWHKADQSTNTIEVAPTSRDGVFALRTSFDSRDTVFVTNKQLLNLTDSIQKGPMRSVIK